ncbi:MAG: cobalamin-binding protein [Deltaproteobacteria bacterium HGW-Deltaproteobacteria-15]|jgi:5-methyltetrahydrofolate--homocysteine methyltransferase|nr:MAG: cobalamin-binding protein [Deltaproteobacteria bacterium HGW-Deltaproteobacteria-15]
MANLEALKQAVIDGNKKDAVALVQHAVQEGVDPERLFNQYLIPAMNAVGDKFQRKEIFVPEMMIAARSMQACMDLLKPLIRKEATVSLGTVVIGTVFGDLHDIGKNLVKLLMESSGFTVVDLGENVPASKFVEEAKAHNAAIIGLSSLLTTGDPHVEQTVKTIKGSELAGKVKIICGGAGVTKKFIEEKCGADAYAENAAEGVKKIRKLLGLG